MVEAITESYKRVLEEAFQKSNSSTVIALISKARDELSQELQDLEGKYLELRRKTPSPIAGVRGPRVPGQPTGPLGPGGE